MERELTNNSSLLLEDSATTSTGITIKAPTMMTIGALDQIGNTILEDGGYDPERHSFTDLIIFLWAHTAPSADVIRLTTSKSLAYSRAYEAAMLWADTIGAEGIEALQLAMQESVERVTAARADAIPDSSNPSKNALGQSAGLA